MWQVGLKVHCTDKIVTLISLWRISYSVFFPEQLENKGQFTQEKLDNFKVLYPAMVVKS